MKNFLKTHRWARITLRILLILLICIAVIAVAALLFINLWPSLGGNASKESKAEYAKRSDNYSDGVFHNVGEFSVMSEADDPYADRTSGKGTIPEDKLPVVTPSFLQNPSEKDLTFTWFGHSTSLLQMQGMNILFDPVFSDISSPVSFIGSRRFSDLAMTAEDLPDIDIVIISHDHYDHLDYPTIRKIDSKVEKYVVPLGVENHLERWGVSEDKIITAAWWEEIELNGLTIACTPSRHYSGRKLIDQNATLWASWTLMNDSYKVFESGDTGYGDQFEEIYEKFGDFDLALMDCAQYSTAWHDVHMFPEEAVSAANILHARVAIPIHWGAFTLSNHPWDDPAERFTLNGEETGLNVVTPKLGETVEWSHLGDYQERWWREIR